MTLYFNKHTIITCALVFYNNNYKPMIEGIHYYRENEVNKTPILIKVFLTCADSKDIAFI